jgi:hypothetical protein
VQVMLLCCHSPNAIQVPQNPAMGFLLKNGQRCSVASWRIRNPCGESLTITESPMKPSGEP